MGFFELGGVHGAMAGGAELGGEVAPGFGPVRDAFAQLFAHRAESGGVSRARPRLAYVTTRMGDFDRALCVERAPIAALRRD